MAEKNLIKVDYSESIALLTEEQKATTFPSRNALRSVLETKSIYLSELKKERSSTLNAYIGVLVIIHSTCLFTGVDIFSMTSEEYGSMYSLLLGMIVTGWLMLFWTMLMVNNADNLYWKYVNAINFIKFFEFLHEGYVNKDRDATKILLAGELTSEEKQRYIDAFQAYLPKE